MKKLIDIVLKATVKLNMILSILIMYLLLVYNLINGVTFEIIHVLYFVVAVTAYGYSGKIYDKYFVYNYLKD